VKLEVPTNFPQGEGTLPHSSSQVHFEETNSNIPSSKEPHAADTYSIARERPRRTIRKPAHYTADDESGLIAYALAVAQEIPEGVDPSTYSEAISCAKSSNWLMEIQEEMESLYKNETWQLCELSKGLHALIAK